MPVLPVVSRRVAVLPVVVSIVRAGLNATEGTGKMQLAHQTTVVPSVSEQARHQRWCIIGEMIIAITHDMHGTRIHAREETGPTGRADRALTVGVRERCPCSDQFVDDGCRHVAVAEGTNRVVSLLVGADPENVGRLRRRQGVRPIYKHDCGEGGANVMFATGKRQPFRRPPYPSNKTQLAA